MLRLGWAETKIHISRAAGEHSLASATRGGSCTHPDQSHRHHMRAISGVFRVLSTWLHACSLLQRPSHPSTTASVSWLNSPRLHDPLLKTTPFLLPSFL